MKANMKKLTILGLPVTMLAAGLFAGAMMFGGSNSPTALKNVAHADPPPDPEIRAQVVCTNRSTHFAIDDLSDFIPIPKGVVVTALTQLCPTGFTATGGGYQIFPADAKVRVTLSVRSLDRWLVEATR